jgi:hypothetical protein
MRQSLYSLRAMAPGADKAKIPFATLCEAFVSVTVSVGGNRMCDGLSIIGFFVDPVARLVGLRQWGFLVADHWCWVIQSQKGTLSNRMGNGEVTPAFCLSAPLHRRLAESGKNYCFTAAIALPWPQECRKVPVSLTPRQNRGHLTGLMLGGAVTPGGGPPPT